MFGNKKRKQWMQDFSAFERKARRELARAIAEESMTGERKRKALERISEAEKASGDAKGRA